MRSPPHLERDVHGQARRDRRRRAGPPFRHPRQRKPRSPRRLRQAYRDYNITVGATERAASTADIRAAIRTALARDKFTEHLRPRARRRPRTHPASSPAKPVRATTAVAGLRPDVHPGEVGLGAVGDRAAPMVAERSRNATTRPSPKRWTWSGRPRRVFPIGDQRRRPGRHHRIARRGLHPPRLAAPVTPTCTPTSRSPTRCHHRRRRRHALAGPRRPTRAPATVAASELYNTRLEAHLGQSCRCRFAEPSPRPGKRPVREIVGMPAELIDGMVLAQRGHRPPLGSWPSNSTPPTAANPPTLKRSLWPSKPPWKPAKPNTNRARWPSSATRGAPKPSRYSAASAP